LIGKEWGLADGCAGNPCEGDIESLNFDVFLAGRIGLPTLIEGINPAIVGGSCNEAVAIQDNAKTPQDPPPQSLLASPSIQ
jgi:hypothetical protein